jgi:GH24 family phage-related lysozyme (muramidase)
MSQITKYFSGESVFNWFIGVVESRQDPLELGRLQVRIFGTHNPALTEIPSADLPWAVMVQGLSGKSFSTPKESDVVCGFFLDESKQVPCIWGVIPGIETNPPSTGSGFHDLRPESVIALAPKVPAGRTYNTDGSGISIQEANVANTAVLESLRHPNADELNQPSISGVGRYQNLANTVIQARKSNLDMNVPIAGGGFWSEPYPAYNPEYPYDNATVTESGHIFELDDTPGFERIHLAHRTGTYKEWFPTGTEVQKITKSRYTIVMADDFLHVMGDVNLTVSSGCNIKVVGDAVIEVGNNLSVNVAGDFDASVGGDFNIKATNINLQAEDDITLFSGTQHFTASDSIDATSGATTIGSDGDLNLAAGGNFNAQGVALNLLAEAQAALTGATVGISGVVQINGLASVNQGAPTATGASSPASGSPAGLPGAIAEGTPNTGEADPEVVPVPLNIQRVTLDAFTGTSFLQQQFLKPGANASMVVPDSNTVANTSNCTFDASTKTFLGAPSTWAISENGLALIQGFEGFATVVSPNMVTAYVDPVTGGQPITIGYGTTAVAIGQPVTLGELISRATAQEFLETAITNNFLPTIQKTITGQITQNMLDAMLSLCYNIGPGNFTKSSVRKFVNQGNYCAAGNAFTLWNKAAGQVVAGLTSRRNAERTFFLT